VRRLPSFNDSPHMTTYLARLRRALRHQGGATMAEYAILLAVIALVVIIGARALGSSASAKMNTAATSIGT
jgi:Flp pilus assembly pilin Flp